MKDLLAFWPSLAGGALIGLSAALLLLTDGRVAGISGIAGGLLERLNTDTGWRIAFLTGLICGPMVFLEATGHAPALQILASPSVLVLAGLLVGFGTRLGSGCTSGHGVNGLARFSPRSMAAVATFMVTAVVTVFLVRHSGLLP